MSCAVAVVNSPVFSPSSSRVSSSLFSKTCASSSPDALSLTLNHHHVSSSSVTASSCGSPSSSSCSSPSSPFRLRFQKPLSGFRTKKETSPPALLKRKRPAKIDIPISALSFAPSTVEVLREVEFERDGVSVYCKKGRREAMEDQYSAVFDLQGDPKQAFFGVFDGHGGAKAAEFAAKNLDKHILDELTRREGNEIEDAVKNAYLTTDSEFLKEDLRGGTCCVTALITKGDLVVSNAGDCRAVLSRGGIAEALTSDHRPSRVDEKERIEALGGFVDRHHGVWRLQGSLAVSRGIGDRSLKQWVIAEPETNILKIRPECEFLILASDGLWDKVENQEAVDMIRPLCTGTDKPELMSACRKLAELSVMRGSADDISVMFYSDLVSKPVIKSNFSALIPFSCTTQDGAPSKGWVEEILASTILHIGFEMPWDITVSNWENRQLNNAQVNNHLNNLILGLDIKWRSKLGHGENNLVAILQFYVGWRCLVFLGLTLKFHNARRWDS
ncbi:hypothetical protein NE237_002886 [Protea cynaroides]|uniref:protein-serine/threonine phosphatase n=1 Tax=Protea cynaroides TaxID=273540 RepID=A0A9Q0KFY1_9MAGN|nr:hypothetical protein NE237_002886 [Protea cynaroides]